MSGPDLVARQIGREGQPLVVIDGFAPDPDALRAVAVTSRFEPAGQHYPGVRAPLPPHYMLRRRPVIATLLRDVFGYHRSMRVLDASFSIVTTPPEALSTEQRLPHVDAVAPSRIALVHYLSTQSEEGTAFYRHRSTGFETIDEARASVYFARLNRELREGGAPPAAYIADDTPLFEQIVRIEARYNRALIYRSALLHSGAISPAATLCADPTSGRLTVTAFLEAH